jgi:hypothetical protein
MGMNHNKADINPPNIKPGDAHIPSNTIAIYLWDSTLASPNDRHIAQTWHLRARGGRLRLQRHDRRFPLFRGSGHRERGN